MKRGRIRIFLIGALIGAAQQAPSSDLIILKNGVELEGKIVTEKADAIYVDLGYDLLRTPRDQIDRIEKSHRTPSETEETPENSGAFFVNAPDDRPALNGEDLFQAVNASVVHVKTPRATGSGFFINKQGYLVTNFHVVESENDIAVDVYHDGKIDQRTYEDVRIVALNKVEDLALLKIDSETDVFAPAFMGDFDQVEAGQLVFALGNPYGNERSLTSGSISAKTRPIAGRLYIQTDAAINPGNSGGPLFNSRGDVIGVVSLKHSLGEGLGYAIPVESLKRFLKFREAYAYGSDNPNNPYRYLDPPPVPSASSNQP